MIGRAPTRPPRLALPHHTLPLAVRTRLAHDTAKPKHDPSGQTPEPQEHRKAWFWTAQKLSNFLVIPAVFLYAIFVADFGEREHVFSPPRRWLQQQKDAFFSLTPEERRLAEEQKKSESLDTSKQ